MSQLEHTHRISIPSLSLLPFSSRAVCHFLFFSPLFASPTPQAGLFFTMKLSLTLSTLLLLLPIVVEAHSSHDSVLARQNRNSRQFGRQRGGGGGGNKVGCSQHALVSSL